MTIWYVSGRIAKLNLHRKKKKKSNPPCTPDSFVCHKYIYACILGVYGAALTFSLEFHIGCVGPPKDSIKPVFNGNKHDPPFFFFFLMFH